jgi:hypothetical protein
MMGSVAVRDGNLVITAPGDVSGGIDQNISSNTGCGKCAPASPGAPARSHASSCGRAPSETSPARRRGRTRSNMTGRDQQRTQWRLLQRPLRDHPTRRPVRTTSRATSLSGTFTAASSIPMAWSFASTATSSRSYELVNKPWPNFPRVCVAAEAARQGDGKHRRGLPRSASQGQGRVHAPPPGCAGNGSAGARPLSFPTTQSSMRAISHIATGLVAY